MTTQPITITADEARELLQRAVNEKGADYVYPERFNCRYFNEDGGPSCIVGHVLDYKGLTLDDVPGVENTAALLTIRGDGVIKCDDLTSRALQEAQNVQDCGEPWGYALAEALAVLDKAAQS